MTSLIIAVLALLVGPLLGQILRSRPIGLHVLDGFVFTAICGICYGHLIPEALTEIGALALIPLGLGIMLPLLVEKRFAHTSKRSHLVIFGLALCGLLIHTMIDGAALRGVHGDTNITEATQFSAALGVVLHRIPMSLVLWWALAPVAGWALAGGALTLMGVATIVGYLGADAILHSLNGALAGYALALLAGSILHVVFHQAVPSNFLGGSGSCHNGWGGLGGLLALMTLVLGPGEGIVVHHETKEVFVHFLMESSPALLVGFLAAGIVQMFLPDAGVAWLKRGNSLVQSLKGMAFGLPLPVCSCGVVPVYESLVRRGVGLSAGVAFLIATPELGIDAFLISLPLLGSRITFFRLLAAILVALIVALTMTLVGSPDTGIGKPRGNDCTPEVPVEGFLNRIKGAWTYGTRDLVDHTGPWILMGLLVAALMHPTLELTQFASFPPIHQIVVLSLVGMPFYVCASGATPIAAVLLSKGLAPGAVVAFLLAGPATNATTFGVVARLHGRRFAAVFVAVMVIACTGVGWTLQQVPAFSNDTGSGPEPMGVLYEALRMPATLAVTFLFVAALFRRGPRFLARQVFDIPFPHDHGDLTGLEDHALVEDHNRSESCHGCKGDPTTPPAADPHHPCKAPITPPVSP